MGRRNGPAFSGVEKLERIKPRPLKKSDKIGVVTPAGVISESDLAAGTESLRRAGYAVELAPGVGERKGYLAGRAATRARALESFFARDDIAAIFCARGGFGSVQILPLLNPALVREHPKIFVGYSDVSILLNWLVQSCGLVAFHGPMVAMEFARAFNGRSEELFWKTLSGETRSWEVEAGPVVRPGIAEAELVGGCLSVVVTTLGTPHELETAGKILFLEDVGEKPYRVERMLTHLKMAGKLDKVAGVLFGDFTDCAGDGDREVKEIVTELFADASYPVITGFPAGHGGENLLLPFGVRVRLDGAAGAVSLRESPVLFGGA